MRCLRCDGCLRSERVHWRSRHTVIACINCGDRTDEVILANRRRAKQELEDWKQQIWERIRRLAADRGDGVYAIVNHGNLHEL